MNRVEFLRLTLFRVANGSCMNYILTLVFRHVGQVDSPLLFGCRWDSPGLIELTLALVTLLAGYKPSSRHPPCEGKETVTFMSIN